MNWASLLNFVGNRSVGRNTDTGDGQVGVTRVDMGQPLGNLQFPYAWDLYDPADVLLSYTTACAFLGDTNRLAFCNAGNGTDGAIYIESASTLLAEGNLRTGYVRYNTLELKIFKLLQARIDTTNGGLLIDSIDYADNFFRIGTFAQEASVPEININYPQASPSLLRNQHRLMRIRWMTMRKVLGHLLFHLLEERLVLHIVNSLENIQKLVALFMRKLKLR